jgi:hypothetical protein
VTSSLAENVSGKVRTLDRSRERLAQATQKVEDIIGLKSSLEGVTKAMEDSDFETAAQFIHQFLKLTDSNAMLDAKSSELLRAAEQKLKGVVRVNLAAALAANDQKSIIRFIG